MTKEQIMVDLFEFSSPTYYKWTKKEQRKIFDLLNYAFTLEDLEEFINTNKITKIEKIKENTKDDIILEEIKKRQEEINELTKKLSTRAIEEKGDEILDGFLSKFDADHKVVEDEENKESKDDSFKRERRR